jgi:transposase-like protein
MRRPPRGVPYVQVSQDLNVLTSQLRDWVKKFKSTAGPFLSNGRMKPEQMRSRTLSA